jgi:segregation and condensation protein A
VVKVDAEEKIEKVEDIENLVAIPTWKEMLIDLIRSEKLDPWNIDLSLLAEKYIEKIKKMKMLELRVPANVILAASILLRLKSETFEIQSEEQEVIEETYVDQPGSVGILNIVVRTPPKRAVTLSDLIKALEEVMKIEKRRVEIEMERERKKLEKIEVEIGRDIEDEIEKVFDIIKKHSEDGMITFSEILKIRANESEENKVSKEDIVFSFISLLHLVMKNKIDIFQEEVFGEIIIKLVEENGRKS